MKQEQKIERIRAKCQEILELGKQRTQGLWETDKQAKHPAVFNTEGMFIDTNMMSGDASFIASCAGTAEAMARSTLVALDALDIGDVCDNDGRGCRACEIAAEAIQSILESWPDELL